MDKRKHYVLVVDTETANTLSNGNKMDMSNVLFYDIGWQIIDTRGNVYLERSFINRDIFFNEKRLMRTAYYNDKIPQYIQEILEGKRVVSSTLSIREQMIGDMREFNVTEVAAHNARFDLNALNSTLRYVTKSAMRYWLPYNIVIWDTMKMASSTICKMPTYKIFCEINNYMTANNRVRKTAEVLYKFITHDNSFEESHTGLEDVSIESQIMAYCFRQHKAMKKNLFAERNTPEWTDFQRELYASLRRAPTISYRKQEENTKKFF